MSVHASAYIELMHYKRVIVNWLCDKAIGLYQTRVDRSRVQVQSPEAAYRSRLQEQYTGKGHGVMPVPCILGCSRKLKVEKQLLPGHFPMRLIQTSLEIRILWIYITVKPCQDHDDVFTIIAIY